MYRLKYLPSADLDLAEAEDYLFGYSPAAADKLAEAVIQKSADLVENPFLHPVYKARPYFRRIALPYKYLLFYHVDEDACTVAIHRILHGMRDIENILSNRNHS